MRSVRTVSCEPDDGLWQRAIEYVSADPVRHFLAHADLLPPLAKHSRALVALRRDEVAGVGLAHEGSWPPFLALAAHRPEVHRALFAELLELVERGCSLLCEPEDLETYSEVCAPKHTHAELHMTLEGEFLWSHDFARAVLATEEELAAVRAFYATQDEVLFLDNMVRVGPVAIVWENGEIAAAGGFHLATPHLMHLGAIYTRPHSRRRGFAHAITATLVREARRRERLPSLCVREENEAAVRIYEELGFETVRSLQFARWE